ncbi:caspase-1 isoform X1 [Rhincodon typus]|uniref:caspase-1 isoform X1 n=1 Tax=Rhincodon typus TaxID=259920 RepID=UPI00202F9F97|nr:caspase-1 isoform X1 [Rhincodon typus]
MASHDLRKHYYTLSTSMGPALVEQITCFLYSTQVLSQYELNVISSKSDILTKASELLSAVIRKGKKACGIFFHALATCDPHLSNQIMGTQVNSTGRTLPAPSFQRLTSSNEYLLRSQARPYVSELPRTGEALSFQKEQRQSLPVICKICICNSSLNNCTFGSNNNISITRSMSLSVLDNFAEPASSVNAECGKALEKDSKSHRCGRCNEMSTSSREAIQVESDIEIIRSKLQNIIIGNQNTFTLVEEFSDEDDNEEKELDEEYEENECEEREDTEQLTNETRQPEVVQQLECCRLMAG